MRQKKKGSHMAHCFKVGSVLLCILMVCAFLLPARHQVLAAEKSGAKQTLTHFKDQIKGDPTVKVMYEALESLYISGDMQTGKGSIEITKNLPEGALAAYVNEGKTDLPRAFQAARDAFIQDYPDLFYVDATKLTLRVGQKSADQFIALINNGANENYYAAEFSKEADVQTALEKTKAVKQTIIEKANKKPSVKDRITTVHDELVTMIEYTYPTADNRDVSGIYGALVGKKANCEGYSRAFKWIMDEMGIPCLLVQGSATNSNNLTEAHMWNYVQIEGKWFGVDVTWDDPIQATKKEKAEGIRTKYLLVGSDVLDANHFSSGVFSNGSKDFTYPSLCQTDYSTYISSDIEETESDLQVTTEKSVQNGEVVTIYSIHYNGMTIEKMKAEGLNLAARFAYKADDGVFQPWVDLSDYNIPDTVNPIKLPIGKEGSIQFCITKEKRPDGELTYKKDLSLDNNHETNAITKILKIPYFNNYVSAPFIRKSTPELSSRILPQQQHYRVEYDQLLVREDESKEPGISVKTSQPQLKYAVTNVKTEDATYTLPDGKTRKSTVIEFDFMPDTSFQGYVNTYELQPTNLVGESTKKVPNSIPIITTFPASVPCPIFASQGGNNNAFVLAYPTLVANDKMDIFETDSDFKPSGMDIRLIASIPNAAEEDKMLDALDNKDKVLSSASYDLSLGCQNVTARLSQADYHLTIGVPYPDGFNYNDNKDVTFKAYHYVKQPDGSYKAEELACRITERGLEIIAESFSPFAVVAVPKEDEKSGYKLVSVTTDTQGGAVKTTLGEKEVVAEGLYKLDKNTTSRTFKIKADEGYEIDKLYINGVQQEVKAGAAEYDANFTFGQLKTREVANSNENENTLKVSFVAKTVKDEEKDYTPVAPEIKVEIPELTSIKVADNHVRKVYTEGEVFDATGLVVIGNYSDGATKPLENYMVTDTPLTTDTNAVDVSFVKGKTQLQAKIEGIKVNPQPSEKRLTGINITAQPSKQRYKPGEKFDKAGMKVEAEYLNGEKAEIDNYEIDIADKELTKEDKQAIITYTENGETRNAKVDITIVAPEIKLIELKVNGTPKAEYFEGESFSMDKAVVVAVYNDNSEVTLNSSQYQIAPSGALSRDNTQVTIRYTEGGVTKEQVVPITVKENTLESIAVTTPPTKTTYYSGELFDKAGMVVTATYADKTTKEITNYTVAPESALGKNSQVTVSYEGMEATVAGITIYELDPVLTITPPTKTAYEYGETFDPAGMVVTASYNGGTHKEEVTNTEYSCTPNGALTEIDTKITVTYSKGDKTATAEQAITVNTNQDPAAVPSSIEIEGTPKMEYWVGELFSLEGIKVIATYDNDTTEDVTERITYKNTSLELADTQIVISYLGIEADAVAIDVTELMGISIKNEPKTAYFVGDAFDPTGMEVEATYRNKEGQESTKSVEGYTCTPAAGTVLTKDNMTIEVRFTGGRNTHIASFPITVSEQEDTEKDPTSIEITAAPTKTHYMEGETFDPTGMVVTAHYEDGSKAITLETVADFTYSPDTALTVGTEFVEITYKTVSVKQPITVVKKEDQDTPQNPTPEPPKKPGTDIQPDTKPDKSTPSAVKTGDRQQGGLYLVLVLSMAAVIIFSIKRKKENK